MRRLIYLLIITFVFACGVQDNDTNMESKIELISIGKTDNPSFYLKVTIINHSDQQYYLGEFFRTLPLKIINDKGKNYNQEYLRKEPFAKADLNSDTLINYYWRDSIRYAKTISSAIEHHLTKQMNLNLLRSKDTIFTNGMRESLRGVYEDLMLIESKDTIYNYYRINSLIQSGKRYYITFNYKERIKFPILIGRLFVYDTKNGREEKYFAIYSTKYVKTADKYMHFKQRIRSNQISINH